MSVPGVALRLALGRRLERSPRGQRVLAVAATAYVLLRRRRRCTIERSGAHWVHRWPTATITDPVLTSRPPEDWDAEVHDISLHAYRPQRGDVVIDVGAGVGHETRVLSPLVGNEGRVIAIEANPRIHACLEDMVRRNHLSNVTCVLAAASDRTGTIVLGDVDDHLVSSTVGATTGVEVPAVRIDDLATELGITAVAFVKMNIEGAERQALDGMPDVLARTDEVCISVHDFLADAGGDPAVRTRSAVRAVLERAGFVLETRDDDPRPWVRDCFYGRRARDR